MRATWQRSRVVVVGNGMVGHRFCQRLAEMGGGSAVDLTVFAEEERPAYDRVGLGAVLEGQVADSLMLTSARWYADQGFRLNLGDPVIEISIDQRVVRTRNGVVHPFDRLVLATGSSQVVPPIDVSRGDPGALYRLRTLDDVVRLRDRLSSTRRVVVLGGGLLGVETAAALVLQGFAVEIVEAGPQLLSGRLDPDAAVLLQRHLEERGVRVNLGRRARSLARGLDGHQVALEGGDCLSADLVIVATGVRPRDDLARGSGLATATRGGIEVNELLQTSRPFVYAIGDCASFSGVLSGHVAPGFRMADALARTVLGDPTDFEPIAEPVQLKVAQLEVFLAESTARAQPRRCLIKSGAGTYRKVVVSNRVVVAAQVVGAWRERAAITRAIVTGSRIGPLAQRRFLRSGELWSERRQSAPQRSVHVWTANEIVCRCRCVRVGELKEAIAAGCRTATDLQQATGAARRCGECLPLLLELVGGPQAPASAHRPGATPGLRVAGITTLAMLGAAAALTAGPHLPLPTGTIAGTITDRWPTALWTETRFRNLSGYILVGWLVVAASLPIWKRFIGRREITRTQMRRVARLAHAALGIPIVATAVVHTAGRAGVRLNLALTLAMAGLIAAGAGAAALSDARRRSPHALMRHLHLALLWPVMVLIVIHIAAVLTF